MLQSSNWCNTLSGDGTTPFKVIQIKDQKIIQPEFTITTTENVHLVGNNTGGVKLSHMCLTHDDTWNIESQIIHPFFQINENNVW